MNEEKFCRYGCGMRIKWVEPVVVIEHTFKRCTNIQKAQGRKPYFALGEYLRVLYLSA
ncbi:MAG: hypothetical protein WBZ20_12480 [Nitrososphaeraceae archaeon]